VTTLHEAIGETRRALGNVRWQLRDLSDDDPRRAALIGQATVLQRRLLDLVGELEM